MKRTALFLVVSVLLVSCGGDGETKSRFCKKEYEDSEMMLCLPDDWIVVEKSTLQKRGVPEDAVVAFQSEIAIAGQFPTVVVTKEPLKRTVEAAKYSEASMRSVAVFGAYREIDVSEVEIGKDTLSLHVFTAQPVAEEPLRRFYQLSTVFGMAGYTITGTTPVTIADSVEDEILAIIKSLKFIEPEEEEDEDKEEK